MIRISITALVFLLFFSCTNNGDEASRPDPQVDSTSRIVNAPGTDSNSQENGGRMGDSTGTRSPHINKDSSGH